MERVKIDPRPDWEATADQAGFVFHHIGGELYWDESAYWRFSLAEVEREIEDASTELYAMCLAIADEAAGSQELMERLAIPEAFRDVVADSWRKGDASLYGRFDLAYDGSGAAKLLEFNADTPTSIYETAYFQWQWLEDQIARDVLPDGTDQFNRLHEALINRFKALLTQGSLIHFSSVEDHVEDRSTVRYLEDLAKQAGLEAEFVAIDKIGLDAEGRFVDEDKTILQALFKLYPWEDMLREPYAEHIAKSGTMFIEPAWKALLSNKGLLPLLWERHRGHRNLLPAAFLDGADADEIRASDHALKPLFSREGADLRLEVGGETHHGPIQGYGAEGHVVQAAAKLAHADGQYAVVGSWIVGDDCVAMSIREDDQPITRDTARFVPHVIAD